jgi:hypothetical protein
LSLQRIKAGFLKKLEVNFLENSIFSYGTKLKTKILALICSSAELWLHFKTFPSFLAFEMVEKSWKYRQIKHKKHFREKRKTSFDFSHFSAVGVSEKPL